MTLVKGISFSEEEKIKKKKGTYRPFY